MRSLARAPRRSPSSSRSPRPGARRATTWTARATPILIVAAIINERFVPIRVDADRRPDISERYALGGCPTTAFLTRRRRHRRRRHLCAADRMATVLLRARRRVRVERRAELTAAREPDAPAAAADDRPDGRGRLAAPRVVDRSMREHGGFGSEPKFPLIAPLELALHVYRRRRTSRCSRRSWRPARRDGVGRPVRRDRRRVLQVRGAARLAGAAAREAARRATPRFFDSIWRRPRSLEAARFRERATEVLRYVQTWLADPVDGGWAGSQRADREYYAAGVAGRAAGDRRARRSTRTLYAGANALMASAALRASACARRHRAWRVRAEVARARADSLLQPGRRRRTLRRGPAARARTARRPDCDGLGAARRARVDRKRRLRDDGAGARALRDQDDVGRARGRVLRSQHSRRAGARSASCASAASPS